MAFLAAAVLAAGCYPASNVCDERIEPMVDESGAEVRCARAEDCPMATQTYVCTQTELPQFDCVSCEETRCVRHIPEPCR